MGKQEPVESKRTKRKENTGGRRVARTIIPIGEGKKGVKRTA